MNYNRYFEKLIVKNKERRTEFLNNYVFTHSDNKYHAVHLTLEKGIVLNFTVSSSRSRAFGEENGLIVELYISHPQYYQIYFEHLKQYKNEIEDELDVENIVWQSSEETQSENVCRVYAKKVVNIEDESKWDEYIDWHIETMIKFLNIIPKYINKLQDIRGNNMNYENEFKEWWFNNGSKKSNGSNYADNTKSSYFRELQRLENKIDKSVFQINDLETLKHLLQRLQVGDLKNYNTRLQNTDPSNGLQQYIKFIERKDEIKIKIKQPLVNNKIKNIILYGSPGVGKTYNHKKIISLIEGDDFNEKEIFDLIISNDENDIKKGSIEKLYADIVNEKRMKFITFHQSFGYEDFIEGFRPNEDGDIKLQDGIFKIICDNANNNKDRNYYLVIDEINRGNISKIFGELITLIEEDKRDTLEVTLPYSKKPFKIPSNLYIIGTMNSTDKSIALIDIALRRRFTFLKMEPKSILVKNKKAKVIMEQLNAKITDTLGPDYVLGHSYFMKIEDDGDLDFVLKYKIEPLLEEYFYGDEQGYKNIIAIIGKSNNVTDETIEEV